MKYLMLVFSILLSFNSFGAVYHFMQSNGKRVYNCDKRDQKVYKQAHDDNATWPISLLSLGICKLADSSKDENGEARRYLDEAIAKGKLQYYKNESLSVEIEARFLLAEIDYVNHRFNTSDNMKNRLIKNYSEVIKLIKDKTSGKGESLTNFDKQAELTHSILVSSVSRITSICDNACERKIPDVKGVLEQLGENIAAYHKATSDPNIEKWNENVSALRDYILAHNTYFQLAENEDETPSNLASNDTNNDDEVSVQ